MITWKFHMIDMITVVMIQIVMIWMLVNIYNILIMFHLLLLLMKITNHIWNIIGIIHHNILNQHILLVMVLILA